MKKILLISLSLLSSFVHAKQVCQNEQSLLKNAQIVSRAYQENDAETIIKYTDDSIINLLGFDTFSSLTKNSLMSQKATGISLTETIFSPPVQQFEGEKRIFCILPKVSLMEMASKKAKSKGFFLAIKNKNSDVWKFVEGSGLIKHPSMTEKLFPDLPKDIVFPETKMELY